MKLAHKLYFAGLIALCLVLLWKDSLKVGLKPGQQFVTIAEAPRR